MTKLKQNMEELLHLPPMIDITPTEVSSVPATVSPKPEKSQAASDHEYARENIYDAIGKGQEALENLIELARESESPRSYEVVATLIKTISDASTNLLNVHKQLKEIDATPAATNGTTSVVTNNAVFVGSTAELAKALKDLRG